MVIEYNDYLPGRTQEERNYNLDLLREGVVYLRCTSVGEHTQEEEAMIRHKLPVISASLLLSAMRAVLQTSLLEIREVIKLLVLFA